jgi:hypothetical protein
VQWSRSPHSYAALRGAARERGERWHMGEMKRSSQHMRSIPIFFYLFSSHGVPFISEEGGGTHHQIIEVGIKGKP